MADSIRALIVEDRQDDAEIMVMQLASNGLDVIWDRVETAEDFLAHLTADIDIILADYSLPRFSASDALALLQTSGQDTPLIVVTGSINEEVAVSCMKQGAADYLLKDRLSRLGEAVRHAISERNLGRAQRQSERDLTVLGRAVETSTNGMIMTTLDGRITFVNRAVLDLWAIPDEAAILGQSLNDLLQLPANDSHPLETLQTERSATGEIHSITLTGKAITLQFAASQVSDQAGKLICLMFTFIDATEQKKAELLRIDLDKERELRELKSRFIAMLVHDFRNPLATLQLGLAYIKNRREQITMDQVQGKILMALDQTKRINDLIDDVLQIDEMEYVSSIFAPKVVDIVAFCRAIVADFEQSIDTANHPVRFVCELPMLTYPIDNALLQRAIRNLLSNALKYSPDGGLIQFSISVEDQCLVLRVTDHGIGIPAADFKRIFDGFYRGSNVGVTSGTGLGLAIVKQVIEIHRGTIEAQSELDKGTTFTIRLPQ
jgi:PAS domain S-box-containing protein